MRIDKNKSLEWVSFFVSVKDYIIAAPPEEVQTFALLLIGMASRPTQYPDGRIPLSEIEDNNFSLIWGIRDENKTLLLSKDSALWERGKNEIRIPAYAYDATQRCVKARENGRKGGMKKAANQRSRLSQSPQKTSQEQLAKPAEYKLPDYLKEESQTDDTDNTRND